MATMKVSGFFESRKRSDGEAFTTLKEVAPEWLKEAVREAHQGGVPRDWIYAEAKAAAEAFDEGDLTDEDDVFGYADGRVDIYTKELYAWAADMCLTHVFAAADEEMSEMGSGEMSVEHKDSGGVRVEACLRAIQCFAIQGIARTILDACVKATLAEGEDA